MNPKNKELEKFFETEVKETIPKLIDEYVKLTGMPDSEKMDLYQESKFEIRTQEDSGSTYKFMSEPYIIVDIWDDYYSIKIADQMEEKLFFRTTEIDSFIKYWNNEVVTYFGQNINFPEIKLKTI